MTKISISERLKQIMSEKSIRQTDILLACRPFCENQGVRIGKNDLSQYISGKVIPRYDKLKILSLALNVNEIWLMGYDVPSDAEICLSGKDVAYDKKNMITQAAEDVYEDASDIIKKLMRLDKMDRCAVESNIDELLANDKYRTDGK